MLEFLDSNKQEILSNYPFTKKYLQGKLSSNVFLDDVFAFRNELEGKGFTPEDFKKIHEEVSKVKPKKRSWLTKLLEFLFPPLITKQLMNRIRQDVHTPQAVIKHPRTKLSIVEAQKIQNDYHTLAETLHKSPWMKKITIEQIQTWSSQFYWTAFDNAEKELKTSPTKKVHKIVALHLFRELEGNKDPKNTIKWMAFNFGQAGGRVKKAHPGMVSEYIRRFERGDYLIKGFDKLLHFMTSAAITIYYGPKRAWSVGVFREALGIIKWIKPENFHDTIHDHKANQDGIEFAKSFLKNK